MTIRYGNRTRDAILVSQWVNPRQPLGISYSTIRSINPSNVTVTADTAAHTYGAWTEVIASLSADTSILEVGVSGIGVTTVNTASIISIGIGAAGSEIELFAFAVGGAAAESAVWSISGIVAQIPVRLNSGTRIAVRLQSLVTGGKTALVAIAPFDADPTTFVFGPTAYSTLGVNLATSEGTSIATNSSYSEIVSSTTVPYRGLVVIASAASGTMNTANGTITVAVGAVGSEVDVATFTWRSTTNEAFVFMRCFFSPRNIPQGSRLAVKQSSAQTYIDATLIGVI